MLHVLHVSVHRTFAKVSKDTINFRNPFVPDCSYWLNLSHCIADTDGIVKLAVMLASGPDPTQIKCQLWSNCVARYTKQITKAGVSESIRK